MTLKPSLRVQWILALSIAVVLIVALVLFVNHANQTANAPAPPINRAAIVEENREADIVVSEDQAPHVVALAARAAPAAAATGAVRSYMESQIGHGLIAGPIERSSCTAAAGSSSARLALSCTVEAAYVNYPFDVVVTPGTRQITYCKRDYPPVPSMNIPVSSRCT